MPDCVSEGHDEFECECKGYTWSHLRTLSFLKCLHSAPSTKQFDAAADSVVYVLDNNTELCQLGDDLTHFGCNLSHEFRCALSKAKRTRRVHDGEHCKLNVVIILKMVGCVKHVRQC